MSEQHTINARWISSIVLLTLFLVIAIASGFIWFTGDLEQYTWGLTLTLQVLWGSWVVITLVTILTRVTIFGWSFRRYVRWSEDNMPSWTRFRPSKAPWSKSGVVSFSFTVVMASLLGVCAITTVVMWILRDFTGEWVFWLSFKIIWASWWVLEIGLVLARITVFDVQRKRAIQEQNKPEPTLVGPDKSESNP